jgi:hypothetical protein
LLMPFVSPMVMIVSRRIIQTRDLSRDRSIVLFWACLGLALALLPFMQVVFAQSGVSDVGFFSSVCGLLLIVALNGQYVIWLNESDRSTQSLAFIALFLLSLPLSVAIRSATGIGHGDRSFSIEGILLCLPVLINSTFVRSSGQVPKTELYEFSRENYAKYFMVVLFYNGILSVDWALGHHFLPASVYLPWADIRIVMERAVLSILNIAQVALLWHLLRSSIGTAHDTANVFPAFIIRRFQIALFIAAMIAVLAGISATSTSLHAAIYIPFIIGYLAFGLTSIFLDFYQAKFSVRFVASTFLTMTLGRLVFVAIALRYGSSDLYSIAWSLTSILILAYISSKSWDQIKTGGLS